MALVFFYGTLMRAGANHHVLEDLGASFVAEAKTCTPRALVDLGPYPALLPANAAGASCVWGEVFEIGESAIERLDVFEGCPTLYTRDLVELTTSEGEALAAFVYVFARRPPATARPIEGGRYVARGVVLPSGASADQFDE